MVIYMTTTIQKIKKSLANVGFWFTRIPRRLFVSVFYPVFQLKRFLKSQSPRFIAGKKTDTTVMHLKKLIKIDNNELSHSLMKLTILFLAYKLSVYLIFPFLKYLLLGLYVYLTLAISFAFPLKIASSVAVSLIYLYPQFTLILSTLLNSYFYNVLPQLSLAIKNPSINKDKLILYTDLTLQTFLRVCFLVPVIITVLCHYLPVNLITQTCMIPLMVINTGMILTNLKFNFFWIKNLLNLEIIDPHNPHRTLLHRNYDDLITTPFIVLWMTCTGIHTTITALTFIAPTLSTMRYLRLFSNLYNLIRPYAPLAIFSKILDTINIQSRPFTIRCADDFAINLARNYTKFYIAPTVNAADKSALLRYLRESGKGEGLLNNSIKHPK